ncbi:CD48 antigen-like [Sylvia atricapilla]|uniref:CD48 antigen-like n=1 Tax=Sylvia atricapilla TaxID=48155 RepID=UPI0033973109
MRAGIQPCREEKERGKPGSSGSSLRQTRGVGKASPPTLPHRPPHAAPRSRPAGIFKSLSQPMEHVWVLTLLTVLTLLHQTASPSDTPKQNRTVGGNVTFRSPETSGNGALWRFGNDPIVTVEFGDPPRWKFTKEEYQTRFTVSEDGRALSITQLRMEDAGTYSVNINGNISTFTLQVYRELPEPTVTCETLNCSGISCNIFVHWSMPGDGFGNVSYTWTGWGQRWEGQSVKFGVKKSSLDKPELVNCTARNAVSSRNVTNLEVLCSVQIPRLLAMAPGRQCTLAEISAMAEPGHRDCIDTVRWPGTSPGPATDQL